MFLSYRNGPILDTWSILLVCLFVRHIVCCHCMILFVLRCLLSLCDHVCVTLPIVIAWSCLCHIAYCHCMIALVSHCLLSLYGLVSVTLATHCMILFVSHWQLSLYDLVCVTLATVIVWSCLYHSDNCHCMVLCYIAYCECMIVFVLHWQLSLYDHVCVGFVSHWLLSLFDLVCVTLPICCLCMNVLVSYYLNSAIVW